MLSSSPSLWNPLCTSKDFLIKPWRKTSTFGVWRQMVAYFFTFPSPAAGRLAEFEANESPPCHWEGDWQGRSLSPMPFSHVGDTFRKCGVESANRRLFLWQKHELSQPIVSFLSPRRAGGWGSRLFSLTYSMTLYVLMPVLMPQKGSLVCSSARMLAAQKQGEMQ